MKVIKPIFLKGGSIAEMTLNQWNTLTQKLSLTFEDFNGYDPKEFYDYSNKTKTFWDFYGVSRIELVGTETDYSGNWGAVDNNVFTISYTEPTGSISLDNMGFCNPDTGEHEPCELVQCADDVQGDLLVG